MRFIHIADMHFDSPFVNLSDKDNMGELRRLDQRKVLKKIIEYIKENEIEYLFISGDLYEQKYIKKSTIEYINNLFKEIPDTKIFISPGNHDPYIQNSYYNKFYWNENVKIFDGKIEKYETEDANIYGFGFNDFYCGNCGLGDILIDKNGKSNILVIHGTLNGGNAEGKEYNPISKNILENQGWDYVALGHIHKTDYESKKIVYPGSTISLGFDELGKHGMIVGNLENKELETAFVPVDDKEFILKEIDVTDIISKEELVEKINEEVFDEKYFVEVILIGKRNFEINKYEIINLISNDSVIKIKDNTKIKYDLEKLANENTLKGLFAKEMLEKLKDPYIGEDEIEIIEKAIGIGMEALD